MIHAKDIHENTPWQGLTPGGEIYEPATSMAFNTGDWRTQTPVFLTDKCFFGPAGKKEGFQADLGDFEDIPQKNSSVQSFFMIFL